MDFEIDRHDNMVNIYGYIDDVIISVFENIPIKDLKKLKEVLDKSAD